MALEAGAAAGQGRDGRTTPWNDCPWMSSLERQRSSGRRCFWSWKRKTRLLLKRLPLNEQPGETTQLAGLLLKRPRAPEKAAWRDNAVGRTTPWNDCPWMSSLERQRSSGRRCFWPWKRKTRLLLKRPRLNEQPGETMQLAGLLLETTAPEKAAWRDNAVGRTTPETTAPEKAAWRDNTVGRTTPDTTARAWKSSQERQQSSEDGDHGLEWRAGAAAGRGREKPDYSWNDYPWMSIRENQRSSKDGEHGLESLNNLETSKRQVESSKSMIHVHLSLSLFLYMYIVMCVYIYIYTYVYLFIYMCVCMYIYIYIYIYIHTWQV